MTTPLFVHGLKKLPYQSADLPVNQVKTAHGEIAFVMFGETTEFRVRTFFTKEPETLAWIDGFQAGDVLWDIGANIGCYSLYAASRKDIKVCAFEPSPVNFWLLAANAAMNNFSDRLVTYPFALSKNTRVVQWLPHVSPGSADNQLLREEGGGSVAVQTYSVDELIAIQAAPFPNHIKLDVDGIEPMILAGAEKTLADARLSSVMVEVDESDKATMGGIVELFMRSGFEEPVTRHSPYFENNYYLPVGNYLFKRNQ